MPDVNAPKDDRLGDDYSRGPNPNPGGEIDPGDSALPPYDDRSTGNPETRAGVSRAMGSEPPLREPNEPAAPDDDTSGTEPPSGVGESMTRSGEDVSKADQEGKEAGRYDTGTSAGPAQRPTGGSTDRDQTGVDPN